MTATETLTRFGACPEALEWAKAHGGTLAELWRDCPRVDWLLWYADKAGASLEGLVRAAAACAELALPYAGETRGVCAAAIAAAYAARAADAAVHAVYAADAADAAYARDKMRAACADVVRACVPFVEVVR